jgi:hypothetical protein
MRGAFPFPSAGVRRWPQPGWDGSPKVDRDPGRLCYRCLGQRRGLAYLIDQSLPWRLRAAGHRSNWRSKRCIMSSAGLRNAGPNPYATNQGRFFK